MTNSEILEAITQKKAKPQSGFGPASMLVISVVVYLLIGAQRWDLTRALLLVVAIFIHECGHLLAMRLCRYKNLKMLFIPFFGAVASGQPSEQNGLKIALISLSGPLAGLAAAGLGMLTWLGSHNPILLDFALLSILLNGFNLMPIVPLDGGHYLNEVLLARYPKAELVFKALAAVALVALAAKLATPGLLVLAFLILASMRLSYATGIAVNRLRADPEIRGGELTESKVGAICVELARFSPQFEKSRFAGRLPGQVENLWGRVNKVFPKPAAAVLLVAAYLITLGVLVPLGYKTAITLKSRPMLALNSDGLARISRGDYAGAVADFDKALELRPNEPTLLVNRGGAELALRRLGPAMADFDQAISLKSTNGMAYYFRALTREATGDFKGAIGDFDRAEPFKPTDPMVYMNRGDSEARVGELARALKDLDRAIALDPKFFESYWIRGFAKDLAADFAGAAADYERAAALSPSSGQVRVRWAIALRRLHREEAKAGLAAAVPGIQDPWLRAIARYLTGTLAEEKFLVLAGPGTTELGRWRQCQAYYYAGIVHLLGGDPGMARTYFEKSVALKAAVLGEAVLAQKELSRLGPAP